MMSHITKILKMDTLSQIILQRKGSDKQPPRILQTESTHFCQAFDIN